MKFDLFSLNSIGYDYDKVRNEITSKPFHPYVVCGIYFVCALMIVSFLVISYELFRADGDWKKLFGGGQNGSV